MANELIGLATEVEAFRVWFKAELDKLRSILNGPVEIILD
jgi:hypothetical protein